MRKNLGQHFLRDGRAAEIIVDAARLGAADRVIEIGPGRGRLTGMIAGRVNRLVAVEVDGRLCELLCRKFAAAENVAIIKADFLDVAFGDLFPEDAVSPGGGIKVIGNIPYYITAPIIEKLFGWKKHIGRIVLTVQKEVAERMAASPGGRTYGALSVFVQMNAGVEIAASIGRKCFDPPPEVDSAVVAMDIRREPLFEVENEAAFSSFVKSIFALRRKMVHNALAMVSGLDREEAAAVLDEAGIDPARRPETVPASDLAVIFKLSRNRGTACGRK